MLKTFAYARMQQQKIILFFPCELDRFATLRRERVQDGYTLTQVTKEDIDAEFPDASPVCDLTRSITLVFELNAKSYVLSLHPTVA